MCSACAGDYENPRMTAPAPDADLAENHEYYPAEQRGDREMPTRKARAQEKTDRAGSAPLGTIAARGEESMAGARSAQGSDTGAKDDTNRARESSKLKRDESSARRWSTEREEDDEDVRPSA